MNWRRPLTMDEVTLVFIRESYSYASGMHSSRESENRSANSNDPILTARASCFMLVLVMQTSLLPNHPPPRASESGQGLPRLGYPGEVT